MQQRLLYAVIVILGGVIVYLLFIPQEPVPAPMAPPEAEPVAEPADEPQAPQESAEQVSTSEQVTIEGLFLGLAEEPTEFQKSFYYLLLDDGTEVVRIDLRPLLGYELTNPIAKLGVDRGQRVVITGTVADTGFAITEIAPAP